MTAPRKEQLSDDVTLWLCDCREVLPGIGRVDAVVTDPPYGLGQKWSGGGANTKASWKLNDGGAAVDWDDFISPALTLSLLHSNTAIVWGGHLYSLPPKRGWLIWDKIVREFTSGHAEMAWTTLDQPVRCFSYAHAQLASDGSIIPHRNRCRLCNGVWDIFRKQN